jgi:hypothetical protein
MVCEDQKRGEIGFVVVGLVCGILSAGSNKSSSQNFQNKINNTKATQPESRKKHYLSLYLPTY